MRSKTIDNGSYLQQLIIEYLILAETSLPAPSVGGAAFDWQPKICENCEGLLLADFSLLDNFHQRPLKGFES